MTPQVMLYQLAGLSDGVTDRAYNAWRHASRILSTRALPNNGFSTIGT